mgnify:CR=1 FL=1
MLRPVSLCLAFPVYVVDKLALIITLTAGNGSGIIIGPNQEDENSGNAYIIVGLYSFVTMSMTRWGIVISTAFKE